MSYNISNSLSLKKTFWNKFAITNLLIRCQPFRVCPKFYQNNFIHVENMLQLLFEVTLTFTLQWDIQQGLVRLLQFYQVEQIKGICHHLSIKWTYKRKCGSLIRPNDKESMGMIKLKNKHLFQKQDLISVLPIFLYGWLQQKPALEHNYCCTTQRAKTEWWMIKLLTAWCVVISWVPFGWYNREKSHF